jgi:ATP-dependent protease ClpP protease subunit
MKTCITLFIIGILLSTQIQSQSGHVITLTKDNHVFFSGEVNDLSVAKAQQQLGQISTKLSKNDVIYLVIDSPGGSVTAGNLFIDFANSLPQKIKPICVFCASMGYHMFQSFNERLVYPSSMLMSHRVSIGGLSGQVPGEATSRLANIIETSQEMDEKVAKRVGMSVEAYQKSIYDELWLSGLKAVKTRHADRIAKIKCDNNLLNGTQKSTVNTLFGPVEIVTSKCPLISGILDFSFKRENFRSAKEALQMVRKAKRTAFWNF